MTSNRAGATGRQGIAATISGNRFACVGQAAGNTDSLDQKETTFSLDGENHLFTKVL